MDFAASCTKPEKNVGIITAVLTCPYLGHTDLSVNNCFAKYSLSTESEERLAQKMPVNGGTVLFFLFV